MKVAKEGGTNTQHQTHTNTLETKTIRIKSWLHEYARAPAITALVAGFLLLAYSVPALMQSSYSPGTITPTLDTVTHPEIEPATVTQPSVIDEPTPSTPTSQQSPIQSSASLHIEVSTRSSVSDQPAQTETSLTINGQPVELPKNQRINEKIETEHGTTRIHGRINAGSGANITISTDSTPKTGAD